MGFLAALFPARLWAYLAIGGAIFAAGGTAAYKVQAWRIDNIKTEHANVMTELTAKANEAEKANQTKLIKAQNDATKRRETIQSASDIVRNERYGLRDKTNSFLAKSTPATCNERASTVAVVFAECTAALEGLAIEADKLASDRQLLIDAWPK